MIMTPIDAKFTDMWIGPALLSGELIEKRSDIRKPVDRELIYFRDLERSLFFHNGFPAIS
jgi:hypothetical protein